jgi:hypothetical protein
MGNEIFLATLLCGLLFLIFSCWIPAICRQTREALHLLRSIEKMQRDYRSLQLSIGRQLTHALENMANSIAWLGEQEAGEGEPADAEDELPL